MHMPVIDIHMPFGKYRGRHLREIGIDYLRWCLVQLRNMDESLRFSIREELDWRAGRSRGTKSSESTAGHTASETTAEPNNVLPGASAIDGVVTDWYRRMALVNHPDRGGHVEAMQAINAANEQLRVMLRARGILVKATS
jgi:hypothetical protein